MDTHKNYDLIAESAIARDRWERELNDIVEGKLKASQPVRPNTVEVASSNPRLSIRQSVFLSARSPPQGRAQLGRQYTSSAALQIPMSLSEKSDPLEERIHHLFETIQN